MRQARLVGMVLLVTAMGLQFLGNAGRASAQATGRDDIPPELRPWQGWALAGAEFLRCPYISGLDATQPASRICHWIGALRIDAGVAGAAFHEEVRVFAPGWVTLPGDSQRWPQNVRLDGAAAPVVNRDGLPAVWIAAEGAYAITGAVPWSRLPDALAVPSNAGIVALTLAGKPVLDPEFRNGAIRLGAPAVRPAEANNLDVRIHRKLTDSLPGRLDTRLTLRVAGEAREEYFGPLLPAGFVPMGLRTPLPARLEADGRLRVQVRPGTWALELSARAPAALEAITVPAARKSAGHEIWSFAADDRLRVGAVEGAAPVDPAQANVPAEWQALPAYLVSAGAELRIVERSRGFAGQDLNRVSVQRDLWRDFDGAGYTFRDRVTGEMQQTWRLDMVAPYELQGARSGQQPLLVTRGLEPGSAGVEWRSRAVDVQATGRLTPSTGEIPASGWNARLTNLAITLHVPPGHRLLAALGVDRAPSAWLDRWQLLDIFMVLLVVTAAFRVAGVTAAVVAGIALLLAHHEQHAITWLFLNLLVAMAIAHAVPEGRFRTWAKVWRNVAFALLGVVLIPFVLTQARIAFFPQLEADAVVVRDQPQPENVDAGAPPAYEVEQKVVSRARPAADAAVALDSAAATSKVAASPPPAPARLPLYAPGTVLQSGPGVPRWNYGVHRARMERARRTCADGASGRTGAVAGQRMAFARLPAAGIAVRRAAARILCAPALGRHRALVAASKDRNAAGHCVARSDLRRVCAAGSACTNTRRRKFCRSCNSDCESRLSVPRTVCRWRTQSCVQLTTRNSKWNSKLTRKLARCCRCRSRRDIGSWSPCGPTAMRLQRSAATTLDGS